MIGTLDRALGRITMYRLVWLTLAALLVVALGYSDKEASLATSRLPPDCSVSDGIKQALKVLAKVA